MGLRDSLQLVNVRDSNTEQQVHEDQSHEDKEDEEKYFSSQSGLFIFHEAVGEVQLAHQHCQHFHKRVVQSVEAVRGWEEGVEHETEGDNDDSEGEEESESGHSHSPGSESSNPDQMGLSSHYWHSLLTQCTVTEEITITDINCQ